jgi:hypothetical protein
MRARLQHPEARSHGAATARPPAGLQRKLSVGTSGDAYEREADQLAEHVMRMPGPGVQRACACGGRCTSCQHGSDTLQAKRLPAGGSAGHDAPATVSDVLRSPGQPLDAQTREFMESRFGHDFSRVRVHADARAADSARAVQAQAYTVGHDIAFGAGHYRPQTAEGQRLLAHELTHVLHQTGGPAAPLLQRKDDVPAPPAATFPAVKFVGCDKTPWTMSFVETSARNAFEETRTNACIKNESLRRDMLDAYKGLTIICEPDAVQGACAETDKWSRVVHLYTTSFKSNLCPGLLEATIFHESIHVAEPGNPFEGNLAFDCGEACYPGTDQLKRGDPSRCTYETGFLLVGGLSAGRAFPRRGSATNYLRVYVGTDKRRLILSQLSGSLGVGLSIIGESTTGESLGESSSTSYLLSLMSALRFDPGEQGGGYVSLFGGPEIALGEKAVGYHLGTRVGVRFSVYDISLDAGIEYDPTRKNGQERLYTLGATFQVAPKVRRR